MSQEKITIKTYKIVEETTEMTKDEFMSKYETNYKFEADAGEDQLDSVGNELWKYLVDKKQIVLIEGDYEDLNIDEESFDYNGEFSDYIITYKLPDIIDDIEYYHENTKIATKCKKCDVWFELESKEDESLCKMCK
jgi:hypothetical protein